MYQLASLLNLQANNLSCKEHRLDKNLLHTNRHFNSIRSLRQPHVYQCVCVCTRVYTNVCVCVGVGMLHFTMTHNKVCLPLCVCQFAHFVFAQRARANKRCQRASTEWESPNTEGQSEWERERERQQKRGQYIEWEWVRDFRQVYIAIRLPGTLFPVWPATASVMCPLVPVLHRTQQKVRQVDQVGQVGQVGHGGQCACLVNDWPTTIGRKRECVFSLKLIVGALKLFKPIGSTGC